MDNWTTKFEDLCPCKIAWRWAKRQPDAKTAWKKCRRGDWMLWLLDSLNASHDLIVLAACDCARLSLPYVQEGDRRPLKAIETAEAWVFGQANLMEVSAAGGEAFESARQGIITARASGWAAYFAADSVERPCVAGDVANYAANATSYEHAGTLAKCADIVRARFPEGWRLLK